MRRSCDLCGDPQVRWDWVTPNALTLEEAEAGMGLYFEDEHWLICDPCHQLILEDKKDQITQRSCLNLPTLPEAIFADPILRMVLEEGQRDEVARMHDAFWRNKDTYTEFTQEKEHS